MDKLGLESLLAPKSIEEFLRDDFQKRPFVVQGRSPSVYEGLLSLEQVERAVDAFDPRDGGGCRLMGGDDASGRRNVEKRGQLLDALVAYGRGASINLSGMDHRCPDVGEFRRRLRADFASHGVILAAHGDTVVFITPTHSRALNAHVDPDDLFVLQLEGRKRWNLYAWDPFWNEKSQDELPSRPVLEVELKPGDLLYVPQHWIHAAEAGEDFSFALTVGFRPVSWAELLVAISTRYLFGVAPFFEAVPAWAVAGGRLTPQGRERLIEILRELPDAPILRRAIERVEFGLGPPERALSGGIAAVNRARGIDAKMICALSGRVSVKRQGDAVEIATEERSVKGPPSIEPAFRWFAEQSGEFTVGDIGGGLTENAKLVLARRLVLEGILQMRSGEKT